MCHEQATALFEIESQCFSYYACESKVGLIWSARGEMMEHLALKVGYLVTCVQSEHKTNNSSKLAPDDHLPHELLENLEIWCFDSSWLNYYFK